ncbi:serine hydrolase domain-containing protein [Jiangella asiatica]|uniref:serine hydrolase domain-containing protein n=1 Tax=Jiangella asiatica TaxID=2530372 RepID=UPI0013A5CE06|nr:serine hydrolase domain-containing protein [Jiangella asiatica]
MTRRRLLVMGLAGVSGAVAVGVPTMSRAVAAAGGTRKRQSESELDAALRAMVGGSDDPALEPVGATGLVVANAMRWRGAAGYADWERRQLARSGVDYRFRFGSVGKTFTATMVLQLADEGRLKLDDPVGRHLPDVVPADDQMTVRHLLGMSSGLVDYTTLLSPTLRPGYASYREFFDATRAPIAPRDLVDLAVGEGMRFQPGEHFDYCTTNYIVLGLVLERVTGRPYVDELQRRITDPLGLRHTSVPEGRELPAPFLHGYGHFNDRAREWVDVSIRYEQGWAGGGLVSTMTDVSRFFQALMTGRLLPPRWLTEMKTPLGALPFAGGPDGQDYGLGLQRFDHATGDSTWGHGGQTHGYMNTAMCSADGRLSIVVCYTGFPRREGGTADPSAAFLDVAREVSCWAG